MDGESSNVEPQGKRASHAVVLGCGRSGTSIFGELFAALPGYSYHSEPPFEDLAGYDYGAPVAIKVPKPGAGCEASPGLPFLVADLCAAVPEPREIFWLVRHPLDAICSLRTGIAQNWGHHPRPPDWETWLAQPLLRRCAHHWVHINTLGYDQVRDMAKLHRFEDMIGDPLGFAKSICGQIGLDPEVCEPALRAWARRVQDEDNDDFQEAECSKSYSRPDHRNKVGRWQENLSAAEVAELVPVVAEAAARFGYFFSS
jgi:hypothetical protein